MKEFGNIYLAWRKGVGHRRYIVGAIKKNSVEGVRFNYFTSVVKEAQKDGFTNYTEFPDIDKTYKVNVIDIFGARLIKPERTDAHTFYDFWEVDATKKNDKYYLLGKTQALVPTDNFEFLADFNTISKLNFITDIAGLTHLQLPSDTLAIGDILTFEKDANNPIDNKAIKLFKGTQEIGYIKKMHTAVFHKKHSNKIKIIVKALDKNGVLKKVFVKITF